MARWAWSRKSGLSMSKIAAIRPMRSSLIKAPQAKIATQPSAPTNMIGTRAAVSVAGAPNDSVAPIPEMRIEGAGHRLLT